MVVITNVQWKHKGGMKVSNMIEAQALTKCYNGTPDPAVDEVSFVVRQGEIFSLLGPNGAGKSTILSMLSCLLKPTNGDAHIDGASIIQAPQKVKEVIGVVPQEIAMEALVAVEDIEYREQGMRDDLAAGMDFTEAHEKWGRA